MLDKELELASLIEQLAKSSENKTGVKTICPLCDVCQGYPGFVYERIKGQIAEADLARLDAGIRARNLEVSLVLAPRANFEWSERPVPIYYEWLTPELFHRPLRDADVLALPLEPRQKVWWVLQVFDRSAPFKNAISAIVFHGVPSKDKASWISLSLEKDENSRWRSKLGIGQIKSDTGLDRLVTRQGLFSTIESKKTSTVYFPRFLLALAGKKLGAGLEGHHRREDPTSDPQHNCEGCLFLLRKDIHALLEMKLNRLEHGSGLIGEGENELCANETANGMGRISIPNLAVLATSPEGYHLLALDAQEVIEAVQAGLDASQVIADIKLELLRREGFPTSEAAALVD